MPVPVRYHLRSLLYRKGATVFTLLAVALTVAVLVILLAVGRGFQESMVKSGSKDNLMVLRASATSEGESTITREDATSLAGLPQIAQGKDGKPIFAPELYAGLALDREGGGLTNVALRGVAEGSFAVRPQITIEKGRKFQPGSRELVIGKSLEGRIQGCRIGGSVLIDKEPWPVVGVMDAQETAYDSEIWGDVEILVQVFDRTFYNSFIFKAAPGTDPGRNADRPKGIEATGLVRHISDRIGAVKIVDEQTYFSDQAGFLGMALQGAAIFLTVLMSFGALAGLLNTFLASVAGRTREIGALLAIGYRPRHVFFGFVIESVILSLVGGVLGILFALPWNGLKTGTTNWSTFTEQAFRFQIDGPVIVPALVLALVVGLLGGVFPAWRASRLKPVDSLRRG